MMRQLERLMLGDTDLTDDMKGLRIPGITLEDIEKAVRKVFGEGKTRELIQ